jgi:hypothetical protein
MKKTVVFLWAAIMAANIYAQQAKVHIFMKDGTENEIVTSAVYFSDGFLIFPQEYSSMQIELNAIRKLIFEESSTNVQNLKNESETVVFPNPAADFIQFSGVENSGFQIFSLDGKMMLSGNYASGELLYVGSLAKGFYLVKINNVVIRFIKL